MYKLKTTGLYGRKGVKLGPRGGSIFQVIPVRICTHRPLFFRFPAGYADR